MVLGWSPVCAYPRKASIGGILVLLAGWYFLRHKKYSALAGIGACGITLFLFGFAINPNWVLEFFSILLTKYNQTFGYNPTIWGLTFYITGFRFTSAMAIGATVTISLLILYVYLVWHTRSLTPAEVIGLAIPVTLLVTPYIWPYDQILLLFPIVQIMVMMKNLQVKYLGSSMFFIGISISSYILYAFTVRIEMENLNALLSLIVLASLLSVFWFNNKTRMLDLENKVLQKR